MNFVVIVAESATRLDIGWNSVSDKKFSGWEVVEEVSACKSKS